jgi:hypothetical protein
MYPAADPAAMDLLAQTLFFHPGRRATADMMCSHAYFADMSSKEFMATYIAQKTAVRHSADAEGAAGSKLFSSPIPLRADLESVGESEDNLKFNVRGDQYAAQ